MFSKRFLSKFNNRKFFNSMLDTTQYFRNSELFQFLQNKDGISGIDSVLEIGTFEGLCSLYLAQFSSVSKIDTVDLFPEFDPGSVHVNPGVEGRFIQNFNRSKYSHKVKQFKMTSDEFFESNQNFYNFIYVDGSHDPAQAVRDLDNAKRWLTNAGILWIDDYKSDYVHEGVSLNKSIHDWIERNSSFIVFHKGYQVGLRKRVGD